MAKSKARRASKPTRRRRMRKANPSRTLSQEEKFAHMLVDPCYSSLDSGIYPGEKGLVQRVARTYTVNLGASDTVAQFAFYPGANMVLQNVAANTTTTLSTGFTKVNAPGTSFFDTNALKFRSLGACVECWSNVPPLNLTGNAFFGVVPAWNVQDGIASNADQQTQLLPEATRLTTDKISVKWVPGSHDIYWVATGGAGSGPLILPEDSEDRNAISFILAGLPTNSSLTFRVTNILEWTPNKALGITQNSAHTGAGINPFAVVHAMQTHNPKWNVSITPLMNAAAHVADSGIKALAAGVKKYGPQIAVAGMNSLANATLPMLLG